MFFFFFQAEDGIRDLVRSRGLGDVYKRQVLDRAYFENATLNQQIPVEVVPQLRKQTLAGGSLVVFGNGQQTRDFVYVDDVVSALVAASQAPDVNRQIINVGSGQETTINELIQAIAAAAGRAPEVLYNDHETGGVVHMVADLHKAQRLLGYAPSVTLPQGLAQLLEKDPRVQLSHTPHRGLS